MLLQFGRGVGHMCRWMEARTQGNSEVVVLVAEGAGDKIVVAIGLADRADLATIDVDCGDVEARRAYLAGDATRRRPEQSLAA